MGRFSELRMWFQALGDFGFEIPVVRGAYLSAVGDFVAASSCLNAASPEFRPENTELCREALVSKARVSRGFPSFECSDALPDKLIVGLDGLRGCNRKAVQPLPGSTPKGSIH